MCDLHAQGGLDYDAFERVMLAAEPGPLAQLASEDSSPETGRGPLTQSSSGMASQQALNTADGMWHMARRKSDCGSAALGGSLHVRSLHIRKTFPACTTCQLSGPMIPRLSSPGALLKVWSTLAPVRHQLFLDCRQCCNPWVLTWRSQRGSQQPGSLNAAAGSRVSFPIPAVPDVCQRRWQ